MLTTGSLGFEVTVGIPLVTDGAAKGSLVGATVAGVVSTDPKSNKSKTTGAEAGACATLGL